MAWVPGVPPWNDQDVVLPDRPAPGDDAHPDFQHWYWRDRNTAACRNMEQWSYTDTADNVFSAPGIPDPGQMWRGARPLGSGGHGWAALYERVDADGDVVGTMVVKDMDHDDPVNMFRRMPKEAWIMAQLNNRHTSNIVRMYTAKKYRQIYEDGEHYEPRYRIYQENCPHGNLANLLDYHRQFSEFLPELFICHTFIGLAKAAHTMESGNFHQLGDESDDGKRIVHFDIKTANIFLGDPNPPIYTASSSAAERAFPEIKLGDWGCAQITSDTDGNNPDEYVFGTIGLRPPEQAATAALAGIPEGGGDIPDWWQDPNQPDFEDAEKPWDDFGKYDEKHNVFCIGTVMWEMVTLEMFQLRQVYGNCEAQFDVNHYVQEIRSMRGSKNKPGKKMHRRSEDPYHPVLLELIRRCLHPDPRSRPTAVQLLRETLILRDRVLARTGDSVRTIQKGPSKGRTVRRQPDPHKLYYRGNEINDMEPGQLAFPLFTQFDPNWILTDAPDDAAQADIQGRGEILSSGWIARAQHAHDEPQGHSGAPIVPPKLRWKAGHGTQDEPNVFEYWLMRKRAHHRQGTRWRKQQQPAYPTDCWVDTPEGPQQIHTPTNLDNDAVFEKDVWIEGRNEFGSLMDQYVEVEAARIRTGLS